MRRQTRSRSFGDIDREFERTPREYFAGDFGYGVSSNIDPPGFGHYPESWTTSGPHAGRGPKGYKRSDERIVEDINERLTHHGLIDASDIEVTVRKGEVTLHGTVDSRRTRRMAEEVAESASGVIDVDNQLTVGVHKGARAARA